MRALWITRVCAQLFDDGECVGNDELDERYVRRWRLSLVRRRGSGDVIALLSSMREGGSTSHFLYVSTHNAIALTRIGRRELFYTS